jgi:hypothetical protein
MLLVVARVPGAPEALVAAAKVTGLAPAEVRMRLQGTLPRVLLSDADSDRIAVAVSALRELGFSVVSCDPAVVPSDDSRIVARRVELAADGLAAIDGQENRHPCPGAAITLIQRGARVSQTAKNETIVRRELSLGRAVVSGGLLWTKKVETKSRSVIETRDEFAVLYRGDGEPDIILYERRIDYRFLGPQVAPSSRANFDLLLSKVRAVASSARFDDRVARSGFVAGMPATSADPVDLALFLVAIAA